MEIILAIIGSGALSAVISGILAIALQKREKLDNRFWLLEKDVLRTQLLLMLSDFPEEKTEILKLAQHYFSDLDGNWVLTGMFNKWLVANDIAEPDWFKQHKQ